MSQEQLSNFYPRPPRGGRPASVAFCAKLETFLSTSSARRTTDLRLYAMGNKQISIHVLREEDDIVNGIVYRCLNISIHVLREEDDGHRQKRAAHKHISIHVLREEDD